MGRHLVGRCRARPRSRQTGKLSFHVGQLPLHGLDLLLLSKDRHVEGLQEILREGKLALQIVAGAPADLYLSANVGWMDEVQKAGLIQDGARADLLGNTLVLIAHGRGAAPVTISEELDLVGLLGGGKLAMALVDAVPAGQYGKAALEALGLWEGIAPSVAQSDNVRAALALVATGEAPLGIVYATDAVASDNVTVTATFPDGSHPPIIYPAALLTNATDPADRAFYGALFGAEARTAFEKQGFNVLN